MMTEYDKLIARTWSAVVARGGTGDADEVCAELQKRADLIVQSDDIGRRINEMRLRGDLP